MVGSFPPPARDVAVSLATRTVCELGKIAVGREPINACQYDHRPCLRAGPFSMQHGAPRLWSRSRGWKAKRRDHSVGSGQPHQALRSEGRLQRREIAPEYILKAGGIARLRECRGRLSLPRCRLLFLSGSTPAIGFLSVSEGSEFQKYSPLIDDCREDRRWLRAGGIEFEAIRHAVQSFHDRVPSALCPL